MPPPRHPIVRPPSRALAPTLGIVGPIDRARRPLASTSTMDVHARAEPSAPVKPQPGAVEFHFQRAASKMRSRSSGQIDRRLTDHLTRVKSFSSSMTVRERVNRRIRKRPSARHLSPTPVNPAASSFSNPASTRTCSARARPAASTPPRRRSVIVTGRSKTRVSSDSKQPCVRLDRAHRQPSPRFARRRSRRRRIHERAGHAADFSHFGEQVRVERRPR